jgi:hypothetical protein
MRWLPICFLLFLGACNQQSVSPEQLARQDAADTAVAGLLFENGLDQMASYNVRPDGFVVIKFGDSVSSTTHNDIVGKLREDPRIKGVYAEQAGSEVCPLQPGK